MDSLSSCRLLDLPIMPPAHSFFLVLFCWPMWHHPTKQQHLVWHQFPHVTAEHLCPHSPTEDDTPLCTPRTAILNAFPTVRKAGRGESFAVRLWHILVLEAHFKCIAHIKYSPFFYSVILLIATFPTDLCFLFLHFLPIPSASLILHSLLPLVSQPSLGHRVSWNRIFFFFLGPCVKWNLSSLSRDRISTPCIGDS